MATAATTNPTHSRATMVIGIQDSSFRRERRRAIVRVEDAAPGGRVAGSVMVISCLRAQNRLVGGEERAATLTNLSTL